MTNLRLTYNGGVYIPDKNTKPAAAKNKISKELKAVLIILCGFIVVTLIILAVIYKAEANDIDESVNSANVYFINPSKMVLVPEKIAIDPNDDITIIMRTLLTKSMEGPSSSGLVKTKYSEVVDAERSIEYSSSDNIVNIFFTGKLHEISNSDRIFIFTALTKTLTELEGVDKLRFYADNLSVTPNDSETEDGLSLDNLADSLSQAPVTKKETIIVYFANADGFHVKEEREIDLLQNMPDRAKLVLNELIKGPADSGLLHLIPAETTVLDVKEESGNKFFINFSQSFVDKFTGGYDEAVLMIDSIVNTLTEGSKQRQIQILVGGSKIDDLAGYDLRDFLERNQESIIPEE